MTDEDTVALAAYIAASAVKLAALSAHGEDEETGRVLVRVYQRGKAEAVNAVFWGLGEVITLSGDRRPTPEELRAAPGYMPDVGDAAADVEAFLDAVRREDIVAAIGLLEASLETGGDLGRALIFIAGCCYRTRTDAVVAS